MQEKPTWDGRALASTNDYHELVWSVVQVSGYRKSAAAW